MTTYTSAGGQGWTIAPYPGDSPFKKVRILRQEIIQEIVVNIRHHEYTVVLGPPFSEKTRLLSDLHNALAGLPTFVPISIDLRHARSDSEEEFFTSLALLIQQKLDATGIQEQGIEIVGPGRWFQNFLTDRLEQQTSHITLLFDHLNILPPDLIHALLRSLRAHLMERKSDLVWKIDVVIAGSMDLADLSLSPNSPFNIARPVLLPPLDATQSRTLAQATMAAWGKETSENALAQICTYAGGDCYLIPHLCYVAQELMSGNRRSQVTTTVIEQAVVRLHQYEQAQWSIREAIRIIEDDPDTLLDVLTILDRGSLLRTQSHQTITRAGADRLRLSGAVVFDGDNYRIKNEIYRQRLGEHFTPSRVGHVLRMTGRWQDAIHYLAPRLQHNRPGQARSDLLEAIVQSIYAADNPDKAYLSLVEGIEKGFGLSDVAVYRADVTRSELRLVAGSVRADRSHATPIDLSDLSHVEAQTFHDNGHALRKGENTHRLIAALTPEMRPIGIVTVDAFIIPDDYRGRPPGLGELLRFLRHAAGAIEQVMMRSAFQEIGRAVLSPDAAHSNLQQVLLTVSNALGCDFSALYLLDQAAREVVMEASSGRTSQPQKTLITLDDDHPTTRALSRFREDVEKGRITAMRSDAREGVRILLPLAAAGEVLGVLDLHFEKMRHPQIDADYRSTLITFADQVAIAVYNTKLFERTDQALSRRVEELEAARREAESMRERELHEIAWAIAHRLSNAAGDVPYSMEIIRKNSAGLSSEGVDALDRVQRRFASIVGLLKPMKAITRLEDVPYVQLDLRRVVDEACARVLPRDQIKHRVELPSSALWISGNQPLLCDAFQSVIENACEAMGREGRLAITVSIEERQVKVRIVDTGPGVPRQLFSRIFEPGFSTKEESGESRGSGLYICRLILRRHRGEIRCFSEEGNGATFIITLPLLGQEE